MEQMDAPKIPNVEFVLQIVTQTQNVLLHLCVFKEMVLMQHQVVLLVVLLEKITATIQPIPLILSSQHLLLLYLLLLPLAGGNMNKMWVFLESQTGLL